MVGVSYVPVNDAGVVTQLQEIRGASEHAHHPVVSGSPEDDGFIAVIESRTFLAECFRRSVQAAFPVPVVTYSTVTELEHDHDGASAKTIILSLTEDNNRASANTLKILAEIVPRVPVIVLAYKNDSELARTVICLGAKGFIPVTMGFEIAIRAVRLVLAGGRVCRWTSCSREVDQRTLGPSVGVRPARSQPANSRLYRRSARASQIKQ
jgi:DNA-binding NarL/FixJ family response regulator